MEKIKEMLKQGKKVYVGECMEAGIDGNPMGFSNDREAINFYADYEASAYAYYLDEHDELKLKLIYDPWNW